MEKSSEFLVFYDGQCGLCQQLILWLKKRPSRTPMNYFTLESQEAAILLSNKPVELVSVDSLHCRIDEKWYVESDAVIELAKNLSGFWRWSGIGYLIPKKLRDGLYRFIARRRHCYISENQ